MKGKSIKARCRGFAHGHANGAPRKLYPARLAKRHRRTAAINAALTYEAAVKPIAPPIEDLPDGVPHDNLVLASAWDDDSITVEIGPLNSPPPGLPDFLGLETIYIFVGGVPVVPPVEVRPSDPGDPFSPVTPDVAIFSVPRDMLGPRGDYRVQELKYQVHYTGGIDEGPSQRIAADNVGPAPNSSFAGQLVFSDDIMENGITPDSFIEEDGVEYIEARVPGWTGQKAGDIIKGFIAGVPDPYEDDIGRVDYDHTGTVTVRFTRRFVELFGDSVLDFQYRIVAREALESALSYPTRVSVLLRDVIGDLLEPTVDAYDNDTGYQLVDEQDARTSLEVGVPPNDKIKAGYLVQVHWGSSNTVRVPIDDPDDIRVVVPYRAILDDWLANAPDGGDAEVDIDVGHTIYKDTQAVGKSPTHAVVVNLHVAGGGDPDPGTEPNDNLAAPVVWPDSGEGNQDRIPIGDADQDATVRIAKLGVDDGELVFAAGDRIFVHYEDDVLPVYAVTAADLATPDEPLTINLPNAIIVTNGAGDKAVSYWVERDLASGGTNISKSPIKTIVVETREALPGKGTLAAALLPEMVGVLIGLDAMLDGTPIAIPAYEIFDPNDQIIVYAAVYPGQAHADGEIPVPGFGAEDGDADQANRFTVPVPLVVNPPDTGEVAEPGGPGTRPTRPPILVPHMLIRMNADRFPGLGGPNVYHMHLRYEITNTVGTVVSKVTAILLDPRGTLPPASALGTPATTMDTIASRLRGLMGNIRDLLTAIDKLLH